MPETPSSSNSPRTLVQTAPFVSPFAANLAPLEPSPAAGSPALVDRFDSLTPAMSQTNAPSLISSPRGLQVGMLAPLASLPSSAAAPNFAPLEVFEAFARYYDGAPTAQPDDYFTAPRIRAASVQTNLCFGLLRPWIRNCMTIIQKTPETQIRKCVLALLVECSVKLHLIDRFWLQSYLMDLLEMYLHNEEFVSYVREELVNLRAYASSDGLSPQSSGS